MIRFRRFGQWAAGLTLATGLVFAASASPEDQVAHERLRAAFDEVRAAKVTGFRRLITPRSERGVDPAVRVDRLLEAIWEWRMTVNPESATFVGFPGQNGRWTDWSDAEIAARATLQRESLEIARSLDFNGFDDGRRLSLELLIAELELKVAGQRFPEQLLPVNQMFGEHTQYARTLNAMPMLVESDARDYLSRLQALPIQIDSLIARLSAGLQQRITPPRVALAKVPRQLRALAPAVAADSALLDPLNRLPDRLSAQKQATIRDDARRTYDNAVKPALDKLHRYLVEVYIPGARETIALTQLPAGNDWYAHRVQLMTTTRLSPEAIHQIGLDEVRRIRAGMDDIMTEMKFAGSVPEFVAHLSSQPGQIHASEQAMLDSYRALGKVADARVVKLFRRYPSMPWGIDPVPEFLAAGMPAAYYQAGSAESGRAGIFFINLSRRSQSPKFEMEALLLHEAVPGHHFQIALAHEISGLPEIRKRAHYTAFSEGWGLYAESLGQELGFYTDPASRFGALNYEMWRAIRLVVDTGLHQLGWSRDQAIDFFMENSGRPRDRVETEIDRYLVLPAQALAYKIGALKISELRQRAARALGEQFDVREFHDQVLGAGALPLDVLESRIDAWIAGHDV